MARYQQIKVGKPVALEELLRTPAKPKRAPNPRDLDLALLVNEVAVGPESQALPWEIGDMKVPTARLAANRVIRAAGAEGVVFVSSHPQHKGVLFFSRRPLSNRGRHRAQAKGG